MMTRTTMATRIVGCSTTMWREGGGQGNSAVFHCKALPGCALLSAVVDAPLSALASFLLLSPSPYPLPLLFPLLLLLPPPFLLIPILVDFCLCSLPLLLCHCLCHCHSCCHHYCCCCHFHCCHHCCHRPVDVIALAVMLLALSSFCHAS
jgi:hypothetical protein